MYEKFNVRLSHPVVMSFWSFAMLLAGIGVPGEFCTSWDETDWYERSLEWHEERSIRRSRS
jgi:hypothetical protein